MKYLIYLLTILIYCSCLFVTLDLSKFNKILYWQPLFKKNSQ